MPSSPLENGDRELIMKNDSSSYDMKMSCDEGFDMIGVETVTCNNGLWNRTPDNTKCTSMYMNTINASNIMHIYAH